MIQLTRLLIYKTIWKCAHVKKGRLYMYRSHTHTRNEGIRVAMITSLRIRNKLMRRNRLRGTIMSIKYWNFLEWEFLLHSSNQGSREELPPTKVDWLFMLSSSMSQKLIVKTLKNSLFLSQYWEKFILAMFCDKKINALGLE